jgi:hypothetical protein
MVETTKNHISTSVIRDTSELREVSTDYTKSTSELPEGIDCGPVNASEQKSHPSRPTSTTQAVTLQATENSKAVETDSAEAKPVKTGLDEVAHKMIITDKASSTSDNGNDQVTVDQSCQSILELDGSVNPPEASAAKESEAITKSVSVSVDAKSPMPTDATLKTSLDVKPESPTPKPDLVPSIGSKTMETTDDTHAVDDSLQRLRAPLTETYAPYIQPSDTSLKDARDRLRTALEQTRQLREGFTDRVYKKYRVLLRPVPKSLDSIVDPIVADPAAASRKLQEEINQIKEEKDIEKKEAQKLAALKAPVGPDGAPLPNASAIAAETAEQLAFITSGLSLVVLPEDDVDENEIDLSKYKYRGPTNPETGQRVGGISAAAAAAAEALLDRVRRGAAMRIERQRRRQLQLLTGETSESDTARSIMFPSSLHLMSSSDPARRIPERPTPVAKAAKGPLGTRVSAPFSSPSAAKANRASLSGGALLSLNPSSEDMKPDGKTSAATAALISRGVGVIRPIQQRWRHPHPESLGGRGVSLGAVSSGKKCSASDPLYSSVVGPTVPEYIARSLPPLPNPKSFSELKPVKVHDVSLAGTDRARIAVQAVLGQFMEAEETLTACKKATFESSSDKRNETSTEDDPVVTDGSEESPCAAADKTEASETDVACNVASSQKTCRKRLAMEIDLLHAMQYTTEQEAKLLTETQAAKTHDTQDVGAEVASAKVGESQASSSSRQSLKDVEVVALPIQPKLAFSVMHALGLVKEAGMEKKEKSAESRLSLIDASVFQNEFTGTEMIADDKDNHNETNLKVLIRNILSRKRSFTDTFLSNSMLHVRASDFAGLASFAGNGDRVDGEDSLGESVAKKPRRDEHDEQSGNEIQPATATRKECSVLSIRGGGEEIVDGSDDGIRPEEEVAKQAGNSRRHNWAESDAVRAKTERSSTPGSPDMRPLSGSPMSPSTHDSSLQNQAMLADLAQHQYSLLHPHHSVNGSDILYASDFSPARNSASHGLSSIDRNAALRRHYANLNDSSAHALQLARSTFAMNRLPASHAHQLSGDLSDYFGVQLPTHHSSGYGSHADWSSLSTASAAAAGFLQAHPTLASIGLSPHLGLSVQDRARVLLAREQQQNAAAVRHAVAARRHASTVQATAALLSASPGDIFAHAAGASSVFSHIGGHSTSQTDSGLTGVLEGSPGRRTTKSKTPSKEDSETVSSRGKQLKTPWKSSPSRRSVSKGQSGAKGTESTEDHSEDAESADRKRKSEESRSRKEASRDKVWKSTDAPRNPEAQVKVSSQKEDSSDLKLERRSDVCRDVGSAIDVATTEKTTGKTPGEREIPPKAMTETTTSQPDVFSVEEPSPTPLATSGMQFFVPVAPAALPDDVSNLIVTARFHVVLGDEASSFEGSTLIEYLLAVGGAVPIPKALISNPLKERLNTPGFKNQSNNATPSVPREVR